MALLPVGESFTVDLRYRHFTVMPRLIWQKLFDIYRDAGGYLENMDNILVDYDSCRRALEICDTCSDFLFEMCKDDYQTRWTEYQKDELKEYIENHMSSSIFDIAIHIQLNFERLQVVSATLTRIK